MKNKWMAAWALTLLSAFNPHFSNALAQGSGFTYQGRLNTDGAPASGSYDLQFGLWSAASGPTQVGSTYSAPATAVSNGLFTVMLDFGANFPGADRWLEIAVRTNGGGAYSTLTPRQELTPTPYASYSASAGSASSYTGAIADGQLSANIPRANGPASFTASVSALGFSGDGSALTGLNASQLASGTVPEARLSNNVARLNLNQIFTASNNFNGVLTASNTANLFAGTFTGNGAGLSNVPAATLPPNVALLNTNQTFTASNVFAGVVTAANQNNQFAGTFAGNGAAMTNLNAISLAAGLVPDARLSNNIARLNLNQTFTGTQNFAPGAGSPFTVGNATKVANLNADLLDGLDSTALAQLNSSPTFTGNLAANNITASGDLLGARLNVGYLHGLSGGMASIAGGRYNTNLSNFAFIGAGQNNVIEGNAAEAVVAGGGGNVIQTGSGGATIGGGDFNLIQTNGGASVISGGSNNKILSDSSSSVIGGGQQNGIQTNADFAVIGGGLFNSISNNATYAVVPGGYNNTAGAASTFAAGTSAKASHAGSFVWADVTGPPFASTANNQFLVRATGGVGLGTNNPQSALHVAGTVTATSFSGDAAGLTGLNLSNTVNTAALQGNAVTAAKIASGNVVKSLNTLKDDVTLAAGANLTITPSSQTLTLASPTDWHVSGNAGTTPGLNFLGTTDNQPLEIKVNGQRAMRLEPNTYGENNLISGAYVNQVAPGVVGATIGGGGSANRGGNYIMANDGTIGGGFNNWIHTNAAICTIGGGAYNLIASNAYQSTIAGGQGHKIREDAYDSTIDGGWQNEIQQKAYGSTIAGGTLNTVQSNANTATIGGGGSNQIQTNAQNATIAGGVGNVIQNDANGSDIGGGEVNQILPFAHVAVIGGGSHNTNGAWYATVPGGYQNAALGTYSFAAGRRAKAANQGSFVWADSQNADFSSSTTDDVSFRCLGGVRFTSGSGAANQTVAWTPGGASWTFSSDRNLKDRVNPVDPQSVLEKVARLPIAEWSYIGYDQRHIGPMAQDFHQQFPLNANDKSLNDADLHGVALAAIQGLNQKLEQRETEIADLKTRLEHLERLLSPKNGGAQ